MKIAFVNLYSGLNIRGAEAFAHGLARKLSTHHQVTFFSGHRMNLGSEVRNISIVSPADSPQQGFGYGLINDLKKRLFLDAGSRATLSFILKIAPSLWQNNFDLIIPINGFWEVLICKVIVLLRGGKILITGHSGPGWDERWNLYLKPDVFIASTEPTAIWARKTCPWTRVKTIPYGIEIENYLQSKPTVLSLERPVILCPAASVRYKRVELAIRAVAELDKGSLLHLGSGPLENDINDLGFKLLGEHRFLSTSVPADKIAGYYAACDLVTLPSTSQENSPMVFLEAMSAGKGIVATDTPRSRWIIGPAGSFVENPENIKEYAKALKKSLYTDWETVSRNQSLKYSWNLIIKKYEEVLGQLMKQ